MNPELEKALMLVGKYRVCTAPDFPHLQNISQQEGLLVKFFSFSGGIMGVYYNTFDGIKLFTIKNGLSKPELKHMLAWVGLPCPRSFLCHTRPCKSNT